ISPSLCWAKAPEHGIPSRMHAVARGRSVRLRARRLRQAAPIADAASRTVALLDTTMAFLPFRALIVVCLRGISTTLMTRLCNSLPGIDMTAEVLCGLGIFGCKEGHGEVDAGGSSLTLGALC
ncbi:MAG TPA: hypothetical protein VLU73_07660, partial [Methylococcaceae bacterium]|nr:hypothetical protein [Methylococcaceae bacterium]